MSRRRPLLAIVLKRSDFRESSRVVTLLTREHGRIRALAKGAHRPDSQFLGRLDNLNTVRAFLHIPKQGQPLLSRAELLHEPRLLRQPQRFLAASWLAELTSYGFVADRPDEALFDLLQGGLTLLERTPVTALTTVLAGLELRFLMATGSLPDLSSCVECGPGATLDHGRTHVATDGGGLLCDRHRQPGCRVVPQPWLEWLSALVESPGRQWMRHPPPPSVDVLRLLRIWLANVLERNPSLRGACYRALQRAKGDSAVA